MYMCVVAGTILGIDSKYGKVREVEVVPGGKQSTTSCPQLRAGELYRIYKFFSSGNRLQLVEMR